MKRCPQCSQQYDETWITFCINDGAILDDDFAPRRDRPPVAERPGAYEEPKSERPTMWLPREPPGEGGLSIADGQRPTPVWQPPPPPLPVSSPNQNLAVASLVVGLCPFVYGMFCFFGPVLGITALILGTIALFQIKNSPETVGGKPCATVGVITGALSLVIYVGFFVFVMLMGIVGR